MERVIKKIEIKPASNTISLEDILTECETLAPTGVDIIASDISPIGFGIKKLVLKLYIPVTIMAEQIQQEFMKIDGVQSVDVIDLEVDAYTVQRE